MRDPFAEADRKEHLKRKAAQAKIAVIPPSAAAPQQQAAPTPAASAPAGGALWLLLIVSYCQVWLTALTSLRWMNSKS